MTPQQVSRKLSTALVMHPPAPLWICCHALFTMASTSAGLLVICPAFPPSAMSRSLHTQVSGLPNCSPIAAARYFPPSSPLEFLVLTAFSTSPFAFAKYRWASRLCASPHQVILVELRTLLKSHCSVSSRSSWTSVPNSWISSKMLSQSTYLSSAVSVAFLFFIFPRFFSSSL